MTGLGTDTMTLREVVAIAYGNLAMAHYAVIHGDKQYSRTGYMIRARLTKGLRSGSMSMSSVLDDEKFKFQNGARCSYCGRTDQIVLDHLIPRAAGGRDAGDNLLPACKSCNSSKGSKDVLLWYQARGEFPALMVLRRYLKNLVMAAEAANAMDSRIDSDVVRQLPFAVEAIPATRFPLPNSLRI
jgi:hypothetical protein